VKMRKLYKLIKDYIGCDAYFEIRVKFTVKRQKRVLGGKQLEFGWNSVLGSECWGHYVKTLKIVG